MFETTAPVAWASAPGGRSRENPYVVIPDTFHLVARNTTDLWTGDGLLYQLRTISAPNIPHVNRGALFGIEEAGA